MLKPPQSRHRPRDAAMLDAFEYEAAAETAASLGRAGRRLEATLAALEQHDRSSGVGQDREALVQAAADCAYAMFVQRDLLGLRRDHHLAATYRIPREVMARIGVIAPRRK